MTIVLAVCLMISLLPSCCKTLAHDDDFLGNLLRKDSFYIDKYPYLRDSETGELIAPRDYVNLSVLVDPDRLNVSVSEQCQLYNREKGLQFIRLHTSDRWIYSAGEDSLRALGGQPVADDKHTQCSTDLTKILDGIDQAIKGPNGEEVVRDSLQLYLNAFGRPQRDTYYGSTHWLGSYRGCLRFRTGSNKLIVDNKGHPMNTRYCMGKLESHDWFSQENRKHQGAQPMDRFSPRVSVKIGLCLPETCHTKLIEDRPELLQKIERIMMENFATIYRGHYHLKSVYCLPDADSQLRQISANWLSLSFVTPMAGWLAIQLIVTVFCSPKHWLQSIFNINENIIELMTPRQAKGNELDMQPINAIRSIFSTIIIFGHVCVLLVQMLNSSKQRIYDSGDWRWNFNDSINRAMEVFFVITGLLSSYSLMKALLGGPEGATNKDNYDDDSIVTRKLLKAKLLLGIHLQRLIRLWPMYFVLFWYQKSLSIYTSSGPLWDYGTNVFSPKGTCSREPWWRSIIHLSNVGQDPGSRCTLSTWYLAVDIQIFAIIPIILFVLLRLRSTKARLMFVVTIIVLSTMLVARLMIGQNVLDIATLYRLGFNFGAMVILKYNGSLHSNVLSRLGSVVVGLYAGYHLYRYERGHIKEWPRWLTCKTTGTLVYLVSFFVLISPALIIYKFTITNEPMGDIHQMISLALTRAIWPILVAIVLMRMIRRRDTQSDKQSGKGIMHCTFWEKTNKLSYCMYLCHCEVILHLLNSNRVTIDGETNWQLTALIIMVMICTVLLSAICYVTIELPAFKLLVRVVKNILAARKNETDSGRTAEKEEKYRS